MVRTGSILNAGGSTAAARPGGAGGTAGGAGLFLTTTLTELSTTTLYDSNQLLEAIRVMCNGWLRLGTNKVQSTQPKEPEAAVMMVPEWGLTETVHGPPS